MTQQIPVELVLPGSAAGVAAALTSPVTAGDSVVYTDGQSYTVSNVTIVLKKATPFGNDWEEDHRVINL